MSKASVSTIPKTFTCKQNHDLCHFDTGKEWHEMKLRRRERHEARNNALQAAAPRRPTALQSTTDSAVPQPKPPHVRMFLVHSTKTAARKGAVASRRGHYFADSSSGEGGFSTAVARLELTCREWELVHCLHYVITNPLVLRRLLRERHQGWARSGYYDGPALYLFQSSLRPYQRHSYQGSALGY